MSRDLLMRGMLAGVLAAVLAGLFALAVGEPQVDLAIGFEAAKGHAAHMTGAPELVSRTVQKSFGLFTAVGLYGAAVGGIFSLVFAAGYGRLARIGPRGFALLLAAGAFLAIGLTPALKYPPNPPAVGLHETVAFRTGAYFGMIAFSLAALAAAIQFGRWAGRRWGGFNGSLAAVATYLVLAAVLLVGLPAIDEIPPDYPATVLWKFRLAAIGMQAVLWAVIAVAFGWMAERVLRRAASG
jgi:hypothetical protein